MTHATLRLLSSHSTEEVEVVQLHGKSLLVRLLPLPGEAMLDDEALIELEKGSDGNWYDVNDCQTGFELALYL